jgi:hypothetical protein
MKQFLKALPKIGNCFKNLRKKFPHLLEAKLKEGLFVGPDIRKLIFDEDFLLTMTEGEREAWIAFKNVVAKFLGSNKNCCCKYAREIQSLEVLDELKTSYFEVTLGFFPENLGAVSEEQGEDFRQDLKEVERSYQGRWNVNVIGDCCWMLHREILET